MDKYKWTLEIEVQAKDRLEALRYIQDRIRAFILRGADHKEGKLEVNE